MILHGQIIYRAQPPVKIIRKWPLTTVGNAHTHYTLLHTHTQKNSFEPLKRTNERRQECFTEIATKVTHLYLQKYKVLSLTDEWQQMGKYDKSSQ